MSSSRRHRPPLPATPRWVVALALVALAVASGAAAQGIEETAETLDATAVTAGAAPPAAGGAADGAAGGAAATTAAAVPAAGAATTAAAGGSAPLVLAAHAYDDGKGPARAGLGDRVTVEVRGLTAAVAALPTGCAGLILFLDGVPIPGTPPESCTLDGADGAARFLLDRTEDSDGAWHTLLGDPDGLTRRIKVSVGPEGNIAWPTRVDDFELMVLPKGWFGAFLAFLAFAIVVFVRLARRTALLRDPHCVAPDGAQAPFSLSRCQLGFWMFLTIAAYVFIWMITEELDTITGSVLALLGIGAGTALGSSMIAQGKGQPAGNSPAAPAAPTGETAAAAEAAPVPMPAALQGPAMTRAGASQGLLTDLLNGPQGLSLYRFQMVAWTVVLGFIFCVQVYGRLAMPEFSASLLGLMGISSATYLGAKFPEE